MLNRLSLILLVLTLPCSAAQAQAPEPWTWAQVRQRFEQNNPTLAADIYNEEEAKAQEITAYLRPNPNFNLTIDGTQIVPSQGVWQPFTGTLESPGINYLHERRHKRELRRESAREYSHRAVNPL